MSVLNEELGTNKNNTAVEYLAKLVANDIFADRLVANDILVQKLVASDAFIEKLASSEILFEKYVASISSKNQTSGDTMIYMGKNPRDFTAESEFQFALSDFIGKYGGMKMWVDKLVSKILATGLLSLNIMGCVQTTDGLYSNQGHVWTESENFFETETSSISYILKDYNKKNIFFLSNLMLFVTSDYIQSEKITSLKEFAGGSFIDCTSYHNKIIVITTNGVFYSEDLSEWTELSSLEGDINIRASCGVWKKQDALYIKLDKNFYITTDFVNWTKISLSVSSSNVFITDNYMRILTPLSSNMDVIYSDFSLTTVINPLLSTSYGTNSEIGIENNNIIAVSNKGLTVYSENMSDATEYTYNLTGSLFGKTLFYDGYFYYFSTEIIGTETIAKLNRFNINTPNQIYTYDFEIPFSAGTAYVLYSNGVITAAVQSDGVTVYTSFNNGISFVKIENKENVRYQVPVTFDKENNKYILIATHLYNNSAVGLHLYTSRGHEAGSGITEEALEDSSNFVKFSNGFKIAYGTTSESGTQILPCNFKNVPVILGSSTISNKTASGVSPSENGRLHSSVLTMS